MSEGTAYLIDEEVRSIIDRNYQRAEQLLKSNTDKLHIMAKALIKYETLNSDQIDDIMAGKEPLAPDDWYDDHPPAAPGEAKEPRAPIGDASIIPDAASHITDSKN